MFLSRRHLLAAAASGMLPVAAPRAAPSIGPWRARPLRVIYPFAAGGGTGDAVLRALDARWQALFGQPVLTEHRPGATGRLGADRARQAVPDGSTLLLATNDVLVQAQPLGFDPLQAFTPLALIGPVPLVLAVPASRPVTRVADFADWARARRVGYGSWGEASLSHLLGEQLLQRTLGLDAAHAPYRGLGPMLRDLAGGQIDAGFAVPPAVAPMAAQGLLRALAVTGPTRSVALPDVPTLAELGHAAPVFGLRAWGALLAPAGLPAAEAQALEADVQRAFDNDGMRATLARAGFESGRVERGEVARAMLASDLQVLPALLRGLSRSVN